MPIVAQDPPSQPCIKHLRPNSPLGVEGSVEYRMDGFHLARAAQRLVVVQMMAGRVIVYCADFHVRQALWVIGYASVPDVDELLLKHPSQPPCDKGIGNISNCQVVHFHSSRFCLRTALRIYLSVSPKNQYHPFRHTLRLTNDSADELLPLGACRRSV